jgi:hypothetical protein
MKRRNFVLATATFSLSTWNTARAAESQLTLDGDLNGGIPVNLADHDLLVLPQNHFETSTQWTEKVHRFSGPVLVDLLDHYGAGPGDLQLAAINDYNVTVDRDLITRDATISANRMDGLPFSRRDKGPLWVVFPYDRGVKYQRELVYFASVWQLSQITMLGE